MVSRYDMNLSVSTKSTYNSDILRMLKKIEKISQFYLNLQTKLQKIKLEDF